MSKLLLNRAYYVYTDVLDESESANVGPVET
jgi:hypothetical protein